MNMLNPLISARHQSAQQQSTISAEFVIIVALLDLNLMLMYALISDLMLMLNA